jgi:hypothetical protein
MVTMEANNNTAVDAVGESVPSTAYICCWEGYSPIPSYYTHRRRASLHSPTEPEAGMDGASSFHTVASSPQQLVSSYQISLSVTAYQPLERHRVLVR